MGSDDQINRATQHNTTCTEITALFGEAKISAGLKLDGQWEEEERIYKYQPAWFRVGKQGNQLAILT